MVFVQELLGAGQLVLCQEADLNAVQELCRGASKTGQVL
jgi:hypothetical protein